KMKTLALLIALASLSAPVAQRAWAEETPTPGATAAPTGSDSNLDAAKKRWSEMSEQDRTRLRQNYKKWQSLSPQKKQELVERFKRFQSLSSEKKQRIVRNFERFEKLSPEQREKIRTRFEKFMKLPPQERQKRLAALRKRRETLRAR